MLLEQAMIDRYHLKDKLIISKSNNTNIKYFAHIKELIVSFLTENRQMSIHGILDLGTFSAKYLLC